MNSLINFICLLINIQLICSLDLIKITLNTFKLSIEQNLFQHFELSIEYCFVKVWYLIYHFQSLRMQMELSNFSKHFQTIMEILLTIKFQLSYFLSILLELIFIDYIHLFPLYNQWLNLLFFIKLFRLFLEISKNWFWIDSNLHSFIQNFVIVLIFQLAQDARLENSLFI